MPPTIYILGLSVLLQFAAAGLGLRLIRITGRRATWILIATALTLMGVRRSITLYRFLLGDAAQPPDISSELFFLAVSVLVVVGMALIGPLFLSITRSEATLRESEDLHSNIVESMSEGIVVLDRDFHFRHWSRAMERLTNVPRSELIGTGLRPWDVFPHLIKQGMDDGMRRAMGGEVVKAHDVPFRLPDGTSGYTSETYVPLRNAENEIDGIVCVVRDVSERKQAEDALRESQRALSTLMSNLPGMAYRCANDEDWTMEFVSEGCLGLTGYQPTDLTGGTLPYADLIHPDDRQAVWDDVQAAVRDAQPFRLVYRIIGASGDEKWVWEQGRGIFSPEGEFLALEGFITDISERKRSDESLRHRIEFENLITGISTKFINLPSEEIDYGINRALRTLGEFAGVDRSYVFLFSEDATTMDNTHEWCAEGIEPAIHELQQFPVAAMPWFSKRMRRLETVHVPRVADLPPEAHLEKEEWLRESIQSLVCVPMVCGGSLIGFLGFDSVRAQKSWDEEAIALLRIVGEVFASTLERNRAESRLRLLSSAIEQTTEGVAVADLGGNLLFTNEAYARMHGFSPDELVGKNLTVFHTPEQLPAVEAANRQIRETGSFNGEIWHARRDGTVFPTFMHNSLLRDSRGKAVGMIGTARDITDLKRVEEDLRRAHGDLERRVRERTAELSATNVSLQREIAERTRTEQELAESDERFASLLRSVNDVVWAASADGTQFLYINPAVEQVYGRSTADFLEDPNLWLEAVHPEDRQRATQSARKLLESGHTEMVYRIVRPDGEVRWINDRKSVVFDGDGNPIRIGGIATDITERVKAEEALRESQQRLQGILDNTTAVIYVKDQHGRYLLINRRFEELFDVSSGQLMGKRDDEVFPKEITAAFRANDRRVLQSGVPMEFEEIAPGEDGPHTYISLKFPLLDPTDRPYAVCGISTDITERKRAAVELKLAKEAAEAASRAKSRFLANMSHEIRTPLTALLCAAELLPGDDAGPADRPGTVDVILRNGRHLLSLIDDLLDLSQIEAGQLEVHSVPCSLLEIMADVEAVTAPLHLNPKVEFRVIYESAVPSRIRTDPRRLKQIVINLVNNALKFTQVGHVKVRVRVSPGQPPSLAGKEADDHAESGLAIMVEDTGAGIPGDELEHIFETFAQLDPGATGVALGVGLGLPLSRWFAERLGGSLTVASVENRGSTFTLRVPTGPLDDVEWIPPDETRVPQRSIPPGSPPEAPSRLRGYVLLAEDFRDARDLIAHALRVAGAEVTTVDNGRDAVREAMARPFDLILMDIRMPTMDGVQAARELRAKGWLAPIIALTASTTKRDRERFLAAGFDDLWTKPLSLERLVDQAAAYLATDPPRPRQSPADASRSHPLPLDDPRMVPIVTEFVRSLPVRLRQIEAALASRDLDRAGELLHQLAGTGGIHGYMSLSEEAARLLQATKDGALSGKPDQLTAIKNVIREIARSIPEADAPPPPAPDD